MIDPKSLEFLKLFGAIGWVIVIISPFIWRMIFNYIDKREEAEGKWINISGKNKAEVNEQIDFCINFLRTILWQKRVRANDFITIDEETVETLIDTLKGAKEK